MFNIGDRVIYQRGDFLFDGSKGTVARCEERISYVSWDKGSKIAKWCSNGGLPNIYPVQNRNIKLEFIKYSPNQTGDKDDDI